jgi:hypothetical protein
MCKTHFIYVTDRPPDENDMMIVRQPALFGNEQVVCVSHHPRADDGFPLLPSTYSGQNGALCSIRFWTCSTGTNRKEKETTR